MNLLEIPDKYVDKTTVIKNHTILTHLPCLLLRITIGLFLIFYIKHINKLYLIIFFAIIILMFSYKFFILPKTWKNYLRTVLVYTIGLILISLSSENIISTETAGLVSGILVIVDALMGLQTRHIFSQIY